MNFMGSFEITEREKARKEADAGAGKGRGEGARCGETARRDGGGGATLEGWGEFVVVCVSCARDACYNDSSSALR